MRVFPDKNRFIGASKRRPPACFSDGLRAIPFQDQSHHRAVPDIHIHVYCFQGALPGQFFFCRPAHKWHQFHAYGSCRRDVFQRQTPFRPIPWPRPDPFRYSCIEFIHESGYLSIDNWFVETKHPIVSTSGLFIKFELIQELLTRKLNIHAS
jgi:hypothetical protein